MVTKADELTGQIASLGFILPADIAQKLIQVSLNQKQTPIEVIENAIEILYETLELDIEDPF
jgi:hypothetical protein